MRRRAVVCAILAALVATASSDAESDYWEKWRSEHGEEIWLGPWHFMYHAKIEPVGPALTG